MGAGSVSRVITDGENFKHQVWVKGKGWEDGGNSPVTLRSVAFAPYANPELLARLGIPKAARGDPAGDCHRPALAPRISASVARALKPRTKMGAVSVNKSPSWPKA
jgi:hypothetical protein